MLRQVAQHQMLRHGAQPFLCCLLTCGHVRAEYPFQGGLTGRIMCFRCSAGDPPPNRKKVTTEKKQ